MPAKLGKSAGGEGWQQGLSRGWADVGPATTHLRYADVNGPFPRYYFPAGA